MMVFGNKRRLGSRVKRKSFTVFRIIDCFKNHSDTNDFLNELNRIETGLS